MNIVAFACPLYDMKNHFDLALNLYRSKIENNIDNDWTIPVEYSTFHVAANASLHLHISISLSVAKRR